MDTGFGHFQVMLDSGLEVCRLLSVESIIRARVPFSKYSFAAVLVPALNDLTGTVTLYRYTNL